MVTATDATWQDVALSLIAALPAVIAAASSLKNGRVLAQHDARVSQIERKIDTIKQRQR